MQTVSFACLFFFPMQLPRVVQWALDAEVRQGAQTNGLHCSRASPGQVGKGAKAQIQIPGFWEQVEQGHWPLGGTGSGTQGWVGYQTMEGQPVGAFRSYKTLQPAKNEWLPGLCCGQPCSLTLSLQWFLEPHRWVSHRQCTEGPPPLSPVQSLQASKTWSHLNIHTPRIREINTEWGGEHLHFYILSFLWEIIITTPRRWDK